MLGSVELMEDFLNESEELRDMPDEIKNILKDAA